MGTFTLDRGHLRVVIMSYSSLHPRPAYKSGTYEAFNKCLLMRSEGSHQQSCKVNVGPFIIPNYTVEEIEPQTTYLPKDPNDDPQPYTPLIKDDSHSPA